MCQDNHSMMGQVGHIMRPLVLEHSIDVLNHLNITRNCSSICYSNEVLVDVCIDTMALEILAFILR